MTQFPFITLLLLLPLLGAVSLCFVKEERALWVGVGAAIAALFLAVGMAAIPENFTESRGLFYHVGMDGLSLSFVLLTTFLTPLAMLMKPTHHVRLYLGLFLVLESFLLAAFTALNLVMFYVSFEAVLVPMFFLIGFWGGKNRLPATFKFFLYTAAGSVFMFVGILVLYHYHGSFDLAFLKGRTLPLPVEKWLWVSFFLAFAVKTPLWPLHTWLPDAHVEAPTGASMMLAGVLLKLGGYGFLRYMMPLFPTTSALYAPVVFGLSACGLILMSLIAFAQSDMKRMVAYLSVSHMAVVTFGVFSFESYAVMGGIFQMISHGLTSAALFLAVGILHRAYGTYSIGSYGGLFKALPRWSFLFFLICLSAIGIPLTSGFVGEFLVILGLGDHHGWWAAVVALSFILSAAVVLWLIARILFGYEKLPVLKGEGVPNPMETLALILLILAIFVLGIQPNLLIQLVGGLHAA
jgi:NADH-quinone oxidoreductase subunit M